MNAQKLATPSNTVSNSHCVSIVDPGLIGKWSEPTLSGQQLIFLYLSDSHCTCVMNSNFTCIQLGYHDGEHCSHLVVY